VPGDAQASGELRADLRFLGAIADPDPAEDENRREAPALEDDRGHRSAQRAPDQRGVGADVAPERDDRVGRLAPGWHLQAARHDAREGGERRNQEAGEAQGADQPSHGRITAGATTSPGMPTV